MERTAAARRPQTTATAETRESLAAELSAITTRYYHGGPRAESARDCHLEQARVARKAVAAILAKNERLENDAHADPTAWYDDVASLAARLIEQV
jgi:hypothetical protein